MNKQEFEEGVLRILHEMPTHQVKEFLQDFDFEKQCEEAKTTKSVLKNYKNEYYVKDAKKCLKYLNRIVDYHLVPEVHKDQFHSVILWLECLLVFNSINKPRGRSRKLKFEEMILLRNLKISYKKLFPGKPANFTTDTLIYKIGVLLLDKELPNLTDKYLAKMYPDISN